MLKLAIFEQAAKAKVVRRGDVPCLLVTFFRSTPRIVWQMDLRKTENFRMLVQQDDQEEWDIGYEEQGQPFITVAHFEERDDAEDSYIIIQKAIDKGEESGKMKFFRYVLYFLVLLAAASFIYSFFGRSGEGTFPEPTAMQEAPVYSAPPAAQQQGFPDGVPVNADDVLPNPQ